MTQIVVKSIFSGLTKEQTGIEICFFEDSRALQQWLGSMGGNTSQVGKSTQSQPQDAFEAAATNLAPEPVRQQAPSAAPNPPAFDPFRDPVVSPKAQPAGNADDEIHDDPFAF